MQCASCVLEERVSIGAYHWKNSRIWGRAIEKKKNRNMTNWSQMKMKQLKKFKFKRNISKKNEFKRISSDIGVFKYLLVL